MTSCKVKSFQEVALVSVAIAVALRHTVLFNILLGDAFARLGTVEYEIPLDCNWSSTPQFFPPVK